MDSVKWRHAPYPEGMTETEAQEKKWATRLEAAVLMGVSLRTLRRYMINGKVKYRRDALTGRVFIDMESLNVPVPDRYL